MVSRQLRSEPGPHSTHISKDMESVEASLPGNLLLRIVLEQMVLGSRVRDGTQGSAGQLQMLAVLLTA